MNALTTALLETGLVQFGEFATSAGFRPFQTSLEMIASYPDVLQLAASEAASRLPDTEFLLAAPDAVTLAVVVGMERKLPVVFSRGCGESPVYDLVGAYDIGHAAVLIAGASNEPEQLRQLAEGARRVGLGVHTVLVVVETAPVVLPDSEVIALVRLPEVARRLADAGRLPAGQARAVAEWLPETGRNA